MVSFVLKSGKSVIVHGDFNINNDDSGNLILSPIYAQPSTNKLDEIHSVLNKRLTEPTLEALYEEPQIAIKEEKSPAISYSDIKAEEEAKAKFSHLINTWAINFDQEGVQPDRMELFQNAMMYDSKKIIKLIKKNQGLTQCIYAFLDTKADEDEKKRLSRSLAENIVQLSAFVCPPIGELLEYPPPF